MSHFGACLQDLLHGVYPFTPFADAGNRHPYTFLTKPLGSCLPAVPLSEHSQKPPSGESSPVDSGSATFFAAPPPYPNHGNIYAHWPCHSVQGWSGATTALSPRATRRAPDTFPSRFPRVESGTNQHLSPKMYIHNKLCRTIVICVQGATNTL